MKRTRRFLVMIPLHSLAQLDVAIIVLIMQQIRRCRIKMARTGKKMAM